MPDEKGLIFMQNDNYNEKSIIEQLRNPDLRNEAFTIVVRRYSERIYWHIRNMVLSHEDADDLTQETFIKAWNNLDKFREEAQISTWLYRIAINETITFMKRKQIETIPLECEEGSLAECFESDAYFCGDKADALFREAVGTLPQKQRLIFNMKYFEDMKYEEISNILKTSTGSLKASYHIAVKKIKKIIEERD